MNLNCIYKNLNKLNLEVDCIENNNIINEFHNGLNILLKKKENKYFNNKNKKYLFIGNGINNIIMSLKYIYLIYKPILSDFYSKISDFINNINFNFDLIDLITYPKKYNKIINKNKKINNLLYDIYIFSNYYILIKLFNIKISELYKYFSGIITNNINLAFIFSVSKSYDNLLDLIEKYIIYMFSNDTNNNIFIRNTDNRVLKIPILYNNKFITNLNGLNILEKHSNILNWEDIQVLLDSNNNNNIIDISSFDINDNNLLEINKSLNTKWIGLNLFNNNFNNIYSIEYLFDIFETPDYTLYEKKYQPKITKKNIKNKFSDYFYTPPIIIGGLLNYISNNSMCINAYCNGFFCNISTIDSVDSFLLRTKIYRIIKNIPSGESVIIDINDISNYFWKFELIIQLKQDCISIGGISLSGFLPDYNCLDNILKLCVINSIKVVSIYCETYEYLVNIINLSEKYKEVNIICYWTINDTNYSYIINEYINIRKNDNIFLGICIDNLNYNQVYKYLLGNWCEKYVKYKLPFDVFIINYSLFATDESILATPIKDYIIQHIENDTIKNEITILNDKKSFSIMNTDASKLWEYFQNKYFNLSQMELKKKIFEKKTDIIKKLEKYYMKKFIGDLHLMTYYELLKRCINLLTCNNSSNWINIHYEWKMKDLIKWILSKFKIILEIGLDQDSFNIIQFIEDNSSKFSLKPIFNNILSSLDIDYFLTLCDKPFQKPVNFIPILDENFEYWFKLDVLDYATELNYVPNYDFKKTIIPLINMCNYKDEKKIKCDKFITKLTKNIIDDLLQNNCKLYEDIYISPINNCINSDTCNKLIKKDDVINFINSYEDFIEKPLIYLLNLPKIYKTYLDTIDNYVPNIISMYDTYIKIYNNYLELYDEDCNKTILIKYYKDQSKIKLDIDISKIFVSNINIYNDNSLIYSIYFLYRPYCWNNMIHEDKNKLVQCNKLLSNLISSKIIKKNKLVLLVDKENLLKFKNITDIENKFNLFNMYIICNSIPYLYYWLFENYNINIIGSIITGCKFEYKYPELINNYDLYTKFDLDFIIRNCENFNKTSDLNIEINILFNGELFLSLIIKLKIPYLLNIQYKQLYKYNYRINKRNKNIIKFLKNYNGVKLYNNINLDNYVLFDIMLIFDSGFYKGIIYIDNKILGNIDSFEKKYLSVFNDCRDLNTIANLDLYSMDYNNFKNNNKNSVNKSINLDNYFQFLDTINEINPIYFNDVIANIYNYKFHYINPVWYLSTIYKYNDKNITKFNSEFFVYNEHFEYININIHKDYVNTINILNNNNTIMNMKLINQPDNSLYFFDNIFTPSVKLNNLLDNKSDYFNYLFNHLNAYIINTYGINIINICQINPVKYTVLLDTDKIKKFYFRNKLIESLDISYYEFYNKNGLLNHPFFIGIINSIYFIIAFYDNENNNLFENNKVFNGNQYGDILSLLICTNLFSIESIIDLIFNLSKYLLKIDLYSYKININLSLNNYKNITKNKFYQINKYLKAHNVNIIINNFKNDEVKLNTNIYNLLILNEFLLNPKKINKNDFKNNITNISINHIQLLNNFITINGSINYNLIIYDIYQNEIYELLTIFFDNVKFDLDILNTKYFCYITDSYFNISDDYINRFIKLTNSIKLKELKKNWNNLNQQNKIIQLLSISLLYKTIINNNINGKNDLKNLFERINIYNYKGFKKI